MPLFCAAVKTSITPSINSSTELKNYAFTKKVASNLHTKLGHPSKVITNATAKIIIYLDHVKITLNKAKEGCISKMVVVHFKILGERLFFDISSPFTPTFRGKRHLLLDIKDSIFYSCINFFQIRFEKCDGKPN